MSGHASDTELIFGNALEIGQVVIGYGRVTNISDQGSFIQATFLNNETIHIKHHEIVKINTRPRRTVN